MDTRQAQDVAHVVDNFLNGTGFVMLAFVGFRALRKRISLRSLVRSAAYYFAMRAIVSGYSALQVQNSWNRWPTLILYGVAGLASIIFAAHLLASEDDIHAVLRTGEEENRIEREHRRDIETARMLNEYQMLVTIGRASNAMVEAQAAKERESV